MPALFHLPLVSIAIVNRNYAGFVADAIQSVKEQTYENIECVILDNGSTDESPDVIQQAIADDRRFSFHRLSENLGHLGAALWLLDHLKGEFITFLDADDMLFPGFVAHHLQVHLGASHATGFTSSNYLIVDSRKVVHAGGAGSLDGRWPYIGPTSFNPHSPRLAAIDDSDLENLKKATRYLPGQLLKWGWSQGSSNMFRRALLERFRPSLAPKAIFGGVDGYFCPIMNAITGTLLINIPLSLYRIHGNNDYAQLPFLTDVRTGGERGEQQGEDLLLLIFSLLLGELDRALAIIQSARYWQVLDSVASISHFNHFIQTPGVKHLLTKHFNELCEKLGRRATVQYLRSRMPAAEVLKIVARGSGRIPRLSDLRIAFGVTKGQLRRRRAKARAKASVTPTQSSPAASTSHRKPPG